jgi:pimeloyl-ACP methyl ester carboxylesterase
VERPATLEAKLVPVVPGSRMTVIEGTGHLSPLEAPDQVARLLEQFTAESRERLATGAAPGA